MRFWDFIFPHKHHEEHREREDRRGTKESSKRRKEKSKEKSREKRREPEPPKPSTESSSIKTTSAETRGSLPKSDVIEETSACAASEDPGASDDCPKSWEYDESDPNGSSGTIGQKIKDLADKSVRRVKKISKNDSSRSKRSSKIISRPIKEKTLDRFMERVKARQESRIKSAERIARESECIFPNAADAVRAESIVAKKDAGSKETTERRKKRKEEEGRKSPSKEKEEEVDSKRQIRSPSKEKRSKEKRKEKEKDGESDSMKSNRSTRSEKSGKSERSERSSRRTKQSPLKQIQKIFPDLSKKGRQERKEKKEQKKKEKEETLRRKSREKNIFVNGRPFWVAAGKMTAAEKAEMTQDDLPLNAAIILEVRKGNIDLPVLPNTVIKFDPWAPLEVLQGRDETLFNHKMLFANTIRSMINSADYTGTDGTTGDGGETPPEKDHNRVKRIDFGPHPTFYWNYDRTVPSKVWREVFRWTGEGVA